MKKTNGVGIFLAILAATLYAINSPFSKLLLDYMPPMLLGVVFISLITKRQKATYIVVGV